VVKVIAAAVAAMVHVAIVLVGKNKRQAYNDFCFIIPIDTEMCVDGDFLYKKIHNSV